MMKFSTKEREIYNQFEQKCGHLVPAGPDHEYQLGKWLIARSFNIEKAEAMLTKHLEWRAEWDLDHILEFQPPDVLPAYYPAGLVGNDREGCPVWIIPFGKADVKGILQCITKRDYIRYTLRLWQTCFEEMASRKSPDGEFIHNMSGIFDLEGFSLQQFMWKPAMDVILDHIKIYEANFPELLKSCIVINAPRAFTIAYSAIKPFLGEATISKIQIFAKSGWMEPVLKLLPVELLPKHYGGKMVDSNGDPKCSSKICYGGIVPKSYYFKNRTDTPASSKEGFNKLSLPQGSKKTLTYKVSDSKTLLSWSFQTEAHDVGFSIHRSINDNSHDVLLPMSRVNCHLVPEQGTLLCGEPGDYVVTFDNEFSYLTGKEVFYKIELEPATSTAKTR